MRLLPRGATTVVSFLVPITTLLMHENLAAVTALMRFLIIINTNLLAQ